MRKNYSDKFTESKLEKCFTFYFSFYSEKDKEKC